MRRIHFRSLAGGLAVALLAGATGAVEKPAQQVGQTAPWLYRDVENLPYEAPRFAAAQSPAGPIPGDFFLLAGSDAFVHPAITPPLRVSNDLLSPGGGTNPESQVEPDIDVNPFNELNLVGVYQESRFRDGGARALNYVTSMDGGVTWIEGSLPGLTVETGGPWKRASDPWVAFGPDNRVYYVSLAINDVGPPSAVLVSVSTDGGLTFGPPVTVQFSAVDFHDKEAIEVDTFPASPHFGNVYVGWDINRAAGGQHLVVSRSTDGGASYQGPVTLRTSSANIGAIPRVGPDGTVYVVWGGRFPGSPDFWVFFAKSGNGGATFSSPRAVQRLASIGVPTIRDGEILPSFTVDRSSGDLYLVWPDARWSGVDQIALSYSRDGGDTWSAPVRVSDGPLDAPTFTGAVAVNGAGEVGVSYTSLENDPQRLFLVDQFLSISRDRGMSFEPRRRMSPVTTDVRWAAWSRQYFLGDYTAIAAGASRFYMLWIFPLEPSKVALPPPPNIIFGFDPISGVDIGFPVPPVRLQNDVFFSRTR